MKAGEADVGMKRRGSQLRRQNMALKKEMVVCRGGYGWIRRVDSAISERAPDGRFIAESTR